MFKQLPRPICKICKTLPGAYNYKVKNTDIIRYRSICDACDKRIHTTHKKDHCEQCGFVPEHRCQLDVDHIDGNHFNNAIENLQTLCANCHRLKTYKSKEFNKSHQRQIA